MAKTRHSISYSNGVLPVYGQGASSAAGRILLDSTDNLIFDAPAGEKIIAKVGDVDSVLFAVANPFLEVLSTAQTDVLAPAAVINVPATIGNRGGFGIKNSSGGYLASFTAEVITPGADTFSVGRADIIVQNLGSSNYVIRMQHDRIDLLASNINRFSVEPNLITLSPDGTEKWNFFDDVLQFRQSSEIRSVTTDGSDNQSFSIGAGGAIASSRGALVQLFGQEHTSSGILSLVSGDAGFIQLQSNANEWRLTNAGHWEPQTHNTFDVGSASSNVRKVWAGDIEAANDLIVQGNLTVNGTTVTLNTTQLDVDDNIITLNKNHSGPPTLDAGLYVERGTEDDSQILFNEAADYWEAGIVGDMKKILRQGDVTAASLGVIDNNTFLQWRNAADDADVNVIKLSSSDNTIIDSLSGQSILLQNNANTSWEFLSNNFIYHNTDSQIRANTSDGSDTSSFAIIGGGSVSSDRGAYVTVRGNEHVTEPGDLSLVAGDTGNIISSVDNSKLFDFQFSGTSLLAIQRQTLGSGSGARIILKNSAATIAQANIQIVKMGSSTGYNALMLGNVETSHTTGAIGLALNVDPSTIVGGSFSGSGEDVFVRRNTLLRKPNVGNTDWEAILAVIDTGVNIVENLSFGTASSSDHTISLETVDGSDHNSLQLFSYSGASIDSDRGASIIIAGNENVSPGILSLQAGNVSGGQIELFSGGSLVWTIDDSGNLLSNNSTGIIATDTVDGTDNKRLLLCGGGASGSGRGSCVEVQGEEYGGNVFISSSDSGNINFATGPSSATVRWLIDGVGAELGDLIPGADNSYNIGSSTKRVATVYANEIDATALTSISTLHTDFIRVNTTAAASGTIKFRLDADNGTTNPAYIFSYDDSSDISEGALHLAHQDNATITGTSTIGIVMSPLAGTGSAYSGTAKIAAIRESATVDDQNTGIAFYTRTGASDVVTDSEKWRIQNDGHLRPATTGATDLGTDTFKVREIYTSEGIRLQRIKLSLSTSLLNFSGSSPGNVDMEFEQTDMIIRAGTSDGSDNGRLTLAGGGVADITRGAHLFLHGNEKDAIGAYLISGDSHTTADLQIQHGPDSGRVTWRISGDEIKYVADSSTNAYILSDTTDGNDTKGFYLCGGGDALKDRGSYIALNGNEKVGDEGHLDLFTGDHANAALRIFSQNGIRFHVNGNSSTNWAVRIDENGDILGKTGANLGIDVDGATVAANSQLYASDFSSISVAKSALVDVNSVAGGGNLDLYSGSGGEIRFLPNTGTPSWTIPAGSNPTLKYDGNALIIPSTNDGSDDTKIDICGGGAFDALRGAGISVRGNENADPGSLELFAGSVAGGEIHLRAYDSAASIRIYTNSGTTERWAFRETGDLENNVTDGGDILFNKPGTTIRDSVETGVSASGTTQATAAGLTYIKSEITSATAGVDDGVRLPNVLSGKTFSVFNASVDTIKIYPASGHQINDLGTDSPYELEDGLSVSFTGLSSTQWRIEGSSGGGSGTGSSYEEITSTTHTIEANFEYVANNASQVVFTLPATMTAGSKVRIVGKGAGGWKIAQLAGQTIHYGSLSTTTGTGGSLDSDSQYDVVEIMCVTDDTTFVVVSGIGNIDIV